jgi:hypothetical protein
MYTGLHRAILGGRPAPPLPKSGNLELFFDGDFVTQSGGNISAALNQSSHGATRDAVQATAGNKPTVGTALNGHGTVHHDGTDDYLQGVFGGGGFNASNGQAHTLVALSKRPAAAQDRGLFDSAPALLTNTGIMLIQSTGSRVYRMVTAGGIGYSFSGSNWIVHFCTFTPSGTAVAIYEGTTSKNTGTSGASNVLQNFRIGRLFQDVFPWDGDWAQILLYNVTFDATDRSNYIAYVNARYGLALS